MMCVPHLHQDERPVKNPKLYPFKMPANQICYSEKYYDDKYEYR